MTEIKKSVMKKPEFVTDEWLEGLVQHIRNMLVKYVSKSEFAKQLSVNPAYITMISNGKPLEAGNKGVLEIAFKSNYEKDRIRHYPSSLPDKAIEYDNTRTRERSVPEKPAEKDPIEIIHEEGKNMADMLIRKTIDGTKPGKDLELINAYLVNRSILTPMPEKKRCTLIKVLVEDLSRELRSIPEVELC